MEIKREKIYDMPGSATHKDPEVGGKFCREDINGYKSYKWKPLLSMYW